jgi:hypothetical protein
VGLGSSVRLGVILGVGIDVCSDLRHPSKNWHSRLIITIEKVMGLIAFMALCPYFTHFYRVIVFIFNFSQNLESGSTRNYDHIEFM